MQLRTTVITPLTVSLVISLAACSTPASQTTGNDGLARAKKQTAQRLETIAEELEGLDDGDRRDRLVELAHDEGAVLTLYGVTNLEEMAENIDAFEEDTGVTVNYFRAGSEEILQRLVEEANAGFRGADAVNENGAEMHFLDQEGLFAPVETPAAADLPAEGVEDTWFWSYIDIFAPAWNTELVTADEAPRTWEDVLSEYGDQLLLEVGDIEWFATIVKDYLMEQKGMSEPEALDVFREAARDATPVDGHTLMVELLAAGEFGVAATPYSHRVQQFKQDGAPVEWEPAVVPLIARPEGVAVHATAEHPATALLFVEWYLTDGQILGKQQDRQPASSAVEGGGLPEQYETLLVDFDAVIEDFDKWAGLYDEILRLSNEDVIEG